MNRFLRIYSNIEYIWIYSQTSIYLNTFDTNTIYANIFEYIGIANICKFMQIWKGLFLSNRLDSIPIDQIYSHRLYSYRMYSKPRSFQLWAVFFTPRTNSGDRDQSRLADVQSFWWPNLARLPVAGNRDYYCTVLIHDAFHINSNKSHDRYKGQRCTIHY